MKNFLISISIFAIISGCSSSAPKPVYQSQTVVSPKKVIVQPVVAPKVEVKQESPFDIAKKSCLADNAQGCIDFGYIMIEEKNYKLAKTVFIEAFHLGDKDGGMRGKYIVECMEKNAESCNMIGYYLKEGKGGIQDYKLARVAYQNAIDLGDKDSLGSLAHLYSNGLGGEKNHFKATKLYEKSCNAGTTDVNYENCYNAGNRYSAGKGVRQDKFKAVELYRKACNGGYASACNSLGYMYDYGKGVRQSKSTAKSYYGKACDMGDDMGCSNYAKRNR